MRTETDYRAGDGTRIAIYALNEQDRKKGTHFARMISVVQRRKCLEIEVDDAPMEIWMKESLATTLRNAGFRPV